MHLLVDFKLTGPFVDTVATSILCRDLCRLIYVADAFVWSRHVFGETDVATAKCCRDLFSLILMSRPLNEVATLTLCI